MVFGYEIVSIDYMYNLVLFRSDITDIRYHIWYLIIVFKESVRWNCFIFTTAIHPSIHPFIHPSIHLSIHPSIHPSITINTFINFSITPASTISHWLLFVKSCWPTMEYILLFNPLTSFHASVTNTSHCITFSTSPQKTGRVEIISNQFKNTLHIFSFLSTFSWWWL